MMKDKKVLVFGMARSGIAAAKLLLLRGAQVWVCDAKAEADFDGALDEAEALDIIRALGGEAVGIEPCGEAKHVFTHVEWHMRGYRIALAEELPGFLWKTPEEIKTNCPIPTALRYYQKKL